jgi:hypothetical protein
MAKIEPKKTAEVLSPCDTKPVIKPATGDSGSKSCQLGVLQWQGREILAYAKNLKPSGQRS